MKKQRYRILFALATFVLVVVSHMALADGSDYVVTDLGTLGGGYSYSEAIDNSGQVFGYSRFTLGGSLVPFVWDNTDGMQYFEGNPRDARRINDFGQEVGTSSNPEGYLQAQIDGEWLPMPIGYQSSVGEGINNYGQAVGHSSTDTHPHPHHAFLWDTNGEMIELGTLGGDQRRAYGINDDCVVVGESSVGSSYAHGFIWDSVNGMQDLNDLILPGHDFEFICKAYDINNAGQIAGHGRIDGTWHAVLLTPVPEPTITVDIKPQSCPNPLNTKSKGVLPVAILGTPDFDVSDIDVSSVLLERVAPIRYDWEDVATPYNGASNDDCMDCTEEGSDSFMDLTFKFEIQEVVAAVADVNGGDCMLLTITGQLFDGTPIEGSDLVVILKKGKWD